MAETSANLHGSGLFTIPLKEKKAVRKRVLL